MFQAVVLHHPTAEHRQEFAAFMHRVIDVVGRAAGLIEFTAWDAQSGPLIAISRWESPQAFQDALPLILSLGPERRPEWSEREDEAFLTEPA